MRTLLFLICSCFILSAAWATKFCCDDTPEECCADRGKVYCPDEGSICRTRCIDKKTCALFGNFEHCCPGEQTPYCISYAGDNCTSSICCDDGEKPVQNYFSQTAGDAGKVCCSEIQNAAFAIDGQCVSSGLTLLRKHDEKTNQATGYAACPTGTRFAFGDVCCLQYITFDISSETGKVIGSNCCSTGGPESRNSLDGICAEPGYGVITFYDEMTHTTLGAQFCPLGTRYAFGDVCCSQYMTLNISSETGKVIGSNCCPTGGTGSKNSLDGICAEPGYGTISIYDEMTHATIGAQFCPLGTRYAFGDICCSQMITFDISSETGKVVGSNCCPTGGSGSRNSLDGICQD